MIQWNKSMLLAISTVALCATAAPSQDPAPTETVLRLYDVRDLANAPRDFPPARLGIQPPKQAPSPSKPPTASLQPLAAELRRLEGVNWDAPAELTIEKGRLVVRQTAASHQRIADHLIARRHQRGRLITVETRVLAVQSDLARKLPDGIHVIDGIQAERLIALAKDPTRAEVLSAPKITAFEGQLANVSLISQTAFISRYDVQAARGAVIGDPVVSTVADGLVLALRGQALKQGWVDLTVDMQLGKLLKPMPELRTRFGTVQVPEIVVQRREQRVRLPAKAWAMLVGFVEIQNDGQPGRPILVLVRATPITQTDLAPRKGK